jgi:hypothetical protein
LEAGDDALALGKTLDPGTHVIDDAAELVAEDITLLELDDGAVEQV